MILLWLAKLYQTNAKVDAKSNMLLSGMICPIVTEQITKTHHDRDELVRQWQTIFCIASGIHFFGVIFYGIFASGELQDWAKAEGSEEKMEMNDDFEQSQYGYGANPNVDTGSAEPPPSYEEVQPLQQQHQAAPSANPFTSGQNNPFRQ